VIFNNEDGEEIVRCDRNICTNEAFIFWQRKHRLFDVVSEELVIITQVEKAVRNMKDPYGKPIYKGFNEMSEEDKEWCIKDAGFLTQEQYIDACVEQGIEYFEDYFTTPKGESIVVFGFYGLNES